MTFQDRLKGSYQWCVRRLMGRGIVYFHVPKCAGRSLNRALRLRYLLSEVGLDSGASREGARVTAEADGDAALRIATDRFREAFLVYQLHAGIRCIVGHFRFSEAALSQFGDRYSFVTLLREPVSRYLSHYYYSARVGDYSAVSGSLEEYLDTFEGRRGGSIYSEFFSGLPMGSDFASAESVALAKEHLCRLSLVGFVDDIQPFARSLSRLLGVRIRVGWENRAGISTTDRKREVSPETMTLIEERCRPDIEVYEFARSLGQQEHSELAPLR
jgi:hypothetical protein